MPSPQKPGPAPLDIIGTLPVTSTATGASLKELMARLGHSSVRAAMMYQHATRDRDRVIALALGDLIRQAADKPDQVGAGGQGERLPAIGVARMWHERGPRTSPGQASGERGGC